MLYIMLNLLLEYRKFIKKTTLFWFFYQKYIILDIIFGYLWNNYKWDVQKLSL